MGLGKSFGISLLTYILLTFAMGILAVVLGGGDISLIFSGITTAPFVFVASFFDSGLVLLGFLNMQAIIAGIIVIVSGGNLMIGLVAILVPLVPSLVAALIAGKMAEGVGQAFGGWMLTPILCGVLFYVMLILAGLMTFSLVGMLGVLLLATFNGLSWSGIACLLGKED